MPTEEIKDLAAKYLMKPMRASRFLSCGARAKAYDMEGREYIDFVAGIAVNILGHGHPDLVQRFSARRRSSSMSQTSITPNRRSGLRRCWSIIPVLTGSFLQQRRGGE